MTSPLPPDAVAVGQAKGGAAPFAAAADVGDDHVLGVRAPFPGVLDGEGARRQLQRLRVGGHTGKRLGV